MSSPGTYTTNTTDMFAVHRALLNALGEAARYVPTSDDEAERVELVGSFYENVLEFLHVHHSGEDELVYPLLEERCQENLPLIQRIDAQHKYLDDPMDEGRAAIAAWRLAPSAVGGQAVVNALSSIVETLRPHLSDEETYVVPLCSQWISPEEWARLPGHAIMSFKADKPFVALGLVYEQLDDDRRESMLAGMPPEFRTVVTQQWLPAFDAFISQVRR
jgi:hemerythrin-like domain-containing protein